MAEIISLTEGNTPSSNNQSSVPVLALGGNDTIKNGDLYSAGSEKVSVAGGGSGNNVTIAGGTETAAQNLLLTAARAM